MGAANTHHYLIDKIVLFDDHSNIDLNRSVTKSPDVGQGSYFYQNIRSLGKELLITRFLE